MQFRLSTRFALAATAMGVVLSAPAMAQEEGAGDRASSSTDIIVTARRVEERLQDVPISMTVFSQAQLDNKNVVTPSDLATYTPSLSVNQRYGPEKSSFAIRGFNQDQSTAPTVGVYFADVVGPRAQGGTTSGNNVGAGAFMDLQNVQVLKGPQGTLFGRNTTGGAILLVPTKPTDSLEGYVEGSLGNYDMRRLQAVVNVPLAETFKVRVGVDRNKRDGFIRNHSGIGPKDYNDLNYFAARVSVVADLTPDLENYTIVSYSNSDTNGFAGPIVACNRALNPGDPLFSPAAAANLRANGRALSTAGPACDQIARGAARGDGLLDADVANPDPYLKLRQWQIINTTTWQAADNLRIRNIASYGEFRERASFSLNSDNFFTKAGQPFTTGAGRPFSFILLNPAGADDNASQTTFTEEFQLQGNTSDDKLTWQAGAYFEKSSPMGWSHGYTAQFVNCADLQTFNCSTPFLPVVTGGNISNSKTQLTFTNIGFYAQGTYNITEQLAFTGGFRYTIDKIEGVNESTRINIATTGGISGMVCNDSFRFNLPDGPDANTDPDPLPVTSGSQCHFELSQKSEKPTWLVNLDYKPIEDVMLYAKYARGYRQGGLSFTNVGRETWEPEKVDVYEIGAKTTFRTGDVNGYFNIAGFYNDFSDQQVFSGAIANPASGIAGGAVILNAGKSRIQGIEVDTSVSFFDNVLRLDAGYTYLDTLVKEIVVPPAEYPFVQFIPQVAQGGPLVLSPENRLTLTATVTLPLDEEIGKISIGGTYIYTDTQLSNSATLGIPADPLSAYNSRGIGELPATNIFNLNVNWDSVMGLPVDAAFFMTNVTDEIYPVQTGNGYNSSGFETLIMGQPRMYGFRLRYRFGN